MRSKSSPGRGVSRVLRQFSEFKRALLMLSSSFSLSLSLSLYISLYFSLSVSLYFFFFFFSLSLFLSFPIAHYLCVSSADFAACPLFFSVFPLTKRRG